MTGLSLGQVIDLSESGMMISAETAVCTDALFQCEIQFSRGIETPVKVGIHELWSTIDADSGATLIGFRFIDIGKDDRRRINSWVNEPGSIYA